MSNWHVITAGPSAGKSSLIRELSARGYRTAPESARIFIDQKISEGEEEGTIREGRDFHACVERVDYRVEGNLDVSAMYFLDRSLADNIAYRRCNDDASVPDYLYDDARGRYGTIFRLERIDFEDDYARVEDEQWAQEIHEEIKTVYEELGYDVVDVPLEPVDGRADMIENNI